MILRMVDEGQLSDNELGHYEICDNQISVIKRNELP